MFLEAILGIIAISVVFCCCTLCCYAGFHHILTEGKADVQPEEVVWEAKHFYDPLPMATPSPPDNIFKPTPYTFKLQNGNGVYSSGLPHAVINPAVLQYPPGHVYDQQRVQQPPPTKPAQGGKTHKESRVKREPSQQRKLSKSRSVSPSPSPHRSPRGTINVWSTNTEFHQPYSYYSNNHHAQNRPHHQQHHHPPPSQQQQHQQHQDQKQYVQLTQEHYPLHEYRKQEQHQYEKEYPPPDEYHHYRQSHGQNNHHRQNHNHRHNHHELDRHQSNHELSRPQLQRQNSQQFQAFMANTHATNVYTPTLQRKIYRTTTTNFKDDVT